MLIQIDSAIVVVESNNKLVTNIYQSIEIVFVKICE